MKKIYSLLLLSVFSIALNAQNRLAYLSYVFPSDSLKGFEEERIKQDALSRGFFGSEYKVFMYRAKRNFINEKFKINNNNEEFNKVRLPLKINAAPCINEDFEATPIGTVASVSGWTISWGINQTSCSMNGCCPTSSALDVWVVNTPISLPNYSINIPNSPLGGNKVIQMNDSITNFGNVSNVEQTFSVTTSNFILNYAYWCFLDASGHDCCDNPYFNVLLYDCSNNLIPVGSLSLTAPGPTCNVSPIPNWNYSSTSISYHNNWQVASVNLSSYIGSCVSMRVVVGDCTQWGHVGFAFFDAVCGANNIMVNGNTYSNNSNINFCGTTATLNASGNLLPCVWSGPPLSGVNSATNIIVTTTVSGTYTLTTGSGTNTSTNVFTLNINPNPSITITASDSVLCIGQNATLTATGANTYTWVPGGFVAPTIVIQPSVTTTYTLTGADVNSCESSNLVTITVNACTGFSNLNNLNTELRIYPNPNNGEFVIEASKEEVVTITNELGQVIRTLKLNSENNYSTKVSGLATGIYFVAGSQFREKVVIAK